MDPSEFRIAQVHVLLELGGKGHAPRWTMGELHKQLDYYKRKLLRAVVDRLRLVGLVHVGGSDEVWATPEARYLVDIGALEE